MIAMQNSFLLHTIIFIMLCLGTRDSMYFSDEENTGLFVNMH